MANTTKNLILEAVGDGGAMTFHLPVDGGSHIYKATLVSQLTATGALVPYSTASSGVCVGVAQHEADNSAGGASDGDVRCWVETKRAYAFANGTAGDAFSEATLIGSVVYGDDDHTVAKVSTGGRKAVGFYMGLEEDGRVRVFVDPGMAKIVDVLQTLADSPATADALRDAIVAAFG